MKDIHILFVDDEKFTLNALERLLRKSPYTRHYAENGPAALKIMAENPIHILVTDMKMPGMDGLELLEQVKKMYPDSVRLALSAYAMTGQLLPCINTGEIYRFITKPIIPEELRQAINDAIDYFLIRKDRIALVNELKQKNEKLRQAIAHQKQIEKQLQRLAVIDDLTGLYNRRYFTTSLEREFEQGRRYNKGLSCLMMDLDHFKQINDTCGHAFGDFVLREFSNRLKKNLRSTDFAFRYGGEEFVLLLPHTALKNALILGERILQSCRTEPFQDDGQSLSATVSIGAVCFNHHQPETPKNMIIMADKKLYQAKETGRDRIVC